MKKRIDLLGQEMPHVGSMVKAQLKLKHLTKADVARKMEIARNGVLEYIRNPSLQVGILWHLSKIIGHNFFEDLAALLPPNNIDENGHQPKQSEADVQLAEKDQRILELEMELKVYKEIVMTKVKD